MITRRTVTKMGANRMRRELLVRCEPQFFEFFFQCTNISITSFDAARKWSVCLRVLKRGLFHHPRSAELSFLFR